VAGEPEEAWFVVAVRFPAAAHVGDTVAFGENFQFDGRDAATVELIESKFSVTAVALVIEICPQEKILTKSVKISIFIFILK
jgi:hypothetical protein